MIGLLLAGSAVGEDLDAIYALARHNDPLYRAAQHDLLASGFLAKQGRAGLLPELSLEGVYLGTSQKILSSDNEVYDKGSSSYPSTNYSLSLAQPLFDLEAWSQYQQAKVREREAVAVFAAAEQDLLLRVATAYLNGLAAMDAKAFAEAELSAVAQHLSLVRERHRSGLVAVAGLHDAEARHALAEADLVSADNVLEDQMQAFVELTGKSIESLHTLRPEFDLDLPEPADPGVWVAMAQETNLSLEALRQALAVAEEEIRLKRAGHAPVVDLVATTNRQDTEGSLFGGGSDIRSNTIMVRLRVPLYAGGRVVASTGEAVERRASAAELLERERRDVERRTRSAYRGIISGVSRVAALRQSVLSSESALELKEEGFRAGLETLLAVLDAERDLFSARRDLAQSRYDYLLDRLLLKEAAGNLGGSDLEFINSLLVP